MVAWLVAEGWVFVLIGFCLLHTAFLFFWWMRVQRRVEQLHWRVDSFWSKMQIWFRQVDNTAERITEVESRSGRKKKD